MEKLTLVCKVTLPPEATMMLKPLKVAVDPKNVDVPPTGLPLLRRLMPLIPVEGFPDPVEEMVTLVKVTGTVPVLVANIWATGKLLTPCN